MTATPATRVAQGIYFFLSYARSAPLFDDSPDPDYWVKVFYRDLRLQVQRLASQHTGWEPGFADYDLPAGSDWKAQLSRALGLAEVFVPLLSPGYLNRSWSLSERDAFDLRLQVSRRAPSASTDGHVQPVLWTPVPPGIEHRDLAAARRLGADAPAYAENGLRALCMLRPYRAQYVTVVERLAQEIVRVAERHPLGPSEAPPPSGTVYPQQTSTPFVIAVLAPTADTAPPGRSPDSYGPNSVAWRPFGDAQARPLVEYAANSAERFGLPTRTVDFGGDGSLLEQYPGLVLIDPWLAATPAGAARLRASLSGLREWVTPLIVANLLDPQYQERGEALATEVAGMLVDIGIAHTQQPAEVPRARKVEQFVELMPTLVAQTRRRFLRLAPGFPPKGPNSDRPWAATDDDATAS